MAIIHTVFLSNCECGGCVCLPVRVVQGRPVLGRRSCQGCKSRGGQGLVAGCPEADQRSRRGGKNHLTLRQRGAETEIA